MALAKGHAAVNYDQALEAHVAYWTDVWNKLDITIDGDNANQQGIRFCIFQLHQTYHGQDPANNIGGKGLTGEAYSGNTFWDTETYCLPFYIFNNPKAAKNLLTYRYKTLPHALEWGKLQDSRGAHYPFGTIDGTESCGVWWHGNLEIHTSVAVAYGIWHYIKLTGDTDFLHREGIEMLLQVSRFYASRGNWGPDGGFGFYGVMGPDEFHTFVNNNCYTNVMVQRMFEYTLEVVAEMKKRAPKQWAAVRAKVKLAPKELGDWKTMARKMIVPQDKKSGVYEQHEGYFKLPHLDIHSIPVTDFPLYDNWALVRIYRYDMIKQPDVLLLHLFFSQDYSLKNKRANFEYYEPRCIHESSLSPSVHSILASEIGEHKQAYEFFRFATRLDIDNYNRNTRQGLHTTSMAGAWMNIIYGFGGLRTDGATLSFKPSIAKAMKGFSFRFLYQGSVLSVSVTKTAVSFKIVEGPAVPILIYDKKLLVTEEGATVPLPKGARG
jgi:maltose phosphorylase